MERQAGSATWRVPLARFGQLSVARMAVHESGILPSLGEHGGILKALKTTVLLTGGLCSKMFGIGLMGYLAFQSMQAEALEPRGARGEANVSRGRQEGQGGLEAIG